MVKKEKYVIFKKSQKPQFSSNFQNFSLKMLGRVPKLEKNDQKILIKYLRLPNELNFHKNV